MSEIADALAAHERGEMSADDVAWAFVKDRVEDHSPSFHWEDAELDRMIALVVSCSDHPKLAATNPADLVSELREQEASERGQLKRSQEKLRKSLRTMTFDWSKAFKLPTINDQLFKQMQSPAFKAPPALGPQLNKQIRAVQPGVLFAQALNDQLASIRGGLQVMSRVAEVPRIEPLRVDTSLWDSVGRLMDSYRGQLSVSSELISSMTSSVRAHDLTGLTEDLLHVARDVEQQEAAEALAVTAEVIYSDLSAEEFADAFAERIRPMFDGLEAKIEASQPTLAEKILILLVAAVITLGMQAMLARVGVPLDAPSTETQSRSVQQPIDDGRGHQPSKDAKKGVRRSAATAKQRLRKEVEALSEAEAERVLPAVQKKIETKRIGEAIAEGYRRIPQGPDENAWAEANAREAIREERW
jgi:hypothetical protein